MLKMTHLMSAILLLTSLSAAAYGDEYWVCKESCTAQKAECMEFAQAATSDVKAVLAKSCEVEADACNADCDEMRSIAGIIRKIQE